MVTFLNFLLVAILVVEGRIIPECLLDLSKTDDKFPLMVNPSKNILHYPDARGLVTIKTEDTLKLSCPGGFLITGDEETALSISKAKCSKKSSLLIGGEEVPISEVSCTKHPYHKSRRTNGTCASNHVELDVGFQISQSKPEEVKDDFLSQLKVCFDEDLQRTLYVHHSMSSEITAFQSAVPRPPFVQDQIFRIGVKKLYKKSTQRKTLNRLLGLKDDDVTYVKDTGDYYLSRGHLAGKADFALGAQQRATFRYVNVAPQWQTVNGGNWNTLEKNIRRLVAKRGISLEIFTGVWGISTLRHSKTFGQVPLYLYVDENGNEAVPIPQVFWKVLYDPKEQKGVALISANNPYVERLEKFCVDVCDEIDWLTWKRNDVKLGLSYCCKVEDFRKTVEGLPDFPVLGLLV